MPTLDPTEEDVDVNMLMGMSECCIVISLDRQTCIGPFWTEGAARSYITRLKTPAKWDVQSVMSTADAIMLYGVSS